MRKGMGRNIVYGIVGVLTIVSFLVVRTLYRANAFATLSPTSPGTCERLASPAGPEDMQQDPRSGLIYLSSTDRRALLGGASDADGDIYTFDPAHPEAGFSALGLAAQLQGRHFYPHGISLYRGDDGRTVLMVVNHPTLETSTVEIFDVFDEEIEGTQVRQVAFRSAVSDPLIHDPNDILAVGPDAFYVSNDHGEGGAMMHALDDYLQLHRASLVYFDGDVARIEAEDLGYANGIAMSADGRELVIAETTGMALKFYQRDPATGVLTFDEMVPVATGVDNIDRAEDGSYWIGAHPQLLKFAGHAKDPKNPSPSHVLKMTRGEGDYGGRVDQVYLGLGDEISGSSVAVEAQGKLYIGQVFDPFLLVCELED